MLGGKTLHFKVDPRQHLELFSCDQWFVIHLLTKVTEEEIVGHWLTV